MRVQDNAASRTAKELHFSPESVSTVSTFERSPWPCLPLSPGERKPVKYSCCGTMQAPTSHSSGLAAGAVTQEMRMYIPFNLIAVATEKERVPTKNQGFDLLSTS